MNFYSTYSPNHGLSFMPLQTSVSILPQFPPNTPIHVQLEHLYQSQRILLSQKETYENYLKMTNENLDILQTQIQHLENTEEHQTTVIMQKVNEAFNNGKTTEEMKAAFEVLKKAVQS